MNPGSTLSTWTTLPLTDAKASWGLPQHYAAGNNLHMNRLEQAFRVKSVEGATDKAKEIDRSQEELYRNVIRRLPPLSDVVFSFKRFNRLRGLPRKPETLQGAGCSLRERRVRHAFRQKMNTLLAYDWERRFAPAMF